MPGIVQSIIVRAGNEHLGEWVTEIRDVAVDFDRAFGHPPFDDIQAIVLFTDNDQTREPVESYYWWAKVDCP